MTVSQLKQILETCEDDDEIWLDTNEGLMVADDAYQYYHEDIGTLIMTYKNNEYKETLN